jgi:hypothetical protein
MVAPMNDEISRVYKQQRRRSWADWQLAIEAVWWLGVIRVALCFPPFRYVLRWMGLIQGTTASTKRKISPNQDEASRLGGAWGSCSHPVA